MRMPRMNGAEMLAAIKKINPEVVTVLLTGLPTLNPQWPRSMKEMFSNALKTMST